MSVSGRSAVTPPGPLMYISHVFGSLLVLASDMYIS